MSESMGRKENAKLVFYTRCGSSPLPGLVASGVNLLTMSITGKHNGSPLPLDRQEPFAK